MNAPLERRLPVLSKATRSLRHTIRTLGWYHGLLYVVARALDRASGGTVRLIKYNLVSHPLRERPLLPGHRGRSVEVREVRTGDALLDRMDRPPAVIAARYAQGARCLAAVRGGELAGFLWWVEGPYAEDEVRCRFVPQPEDAAIWDFDVFVHPMHRHAPVFARLWDVAGEQLRARGFAWSCSRISAFEPDSLAAHARLGARVLGRALFIRVGPAQLLVGSQPLRLHLSRKAAPEIRVLPD